MYYIYMYIYFVFISIDTFFVKPKNLFIIVDIENVYKMPMKRKFSQHFAISITRFIQKNMYHFIVSDHSVKKQLADHYKDKLLKIQPNVKDLSVSKSKTKLAQKINVKHNNTSANISDKKR